MGLNQCQWQHCCCLSREKGLGKRLGGDWLSASIALRSLTNGQPWLGHTMTHPRIRRHRYYPGEDCSKTLTPRLFFFFSLTPHQLFLSSWCSSVLVDSVFLLSLSYVTSPALLLYFRKETWFWGLLIWGSQLSLLPGRARCQTAWGLCS